MGVIHAVLTLREGKVGPAKNLLARIGERGEFQL